MPATYRSWLFVPADRPDRFTKAELSGADVAVVDLEDGVSPDRRADARAHVVAWLSAPQPSGGAVRCVRVNTPGTPDGDADLAALQSCARPSILMIPKAESADQMSSVVAAWSTEAGDCSILAGIETVRGVLRAEEILAVAGVGFCYFGAEDYIADLGGTRTAAGTEVLTPRSLVAMAARIHDVVAVDQIVSRITDLDLLKSDAALGRSLGYRGKICIHPSQVDPCNQAFSSTGDVAWAEQVIAAAAQHGTGAFALNGQMIDAPLIAQARRILGQ